MSCFPKVVVVREKYLGCPIAGRRLDQPSGTTSPAGVLGWKECSVQCELTQDCLYWQVQIGTRISMM